MKRTQNGNNRLPIVLLIPFISMSLSACGVENDTENIVTSSDITDKHSETESVDTQITTELTTSESAEVTTSDLSDTQTTVELTIEDVPELVPDILKIREKEYEEMPFLETQEQLSEYALWNLLYGRTEFECRLSWDLSYNVSAVAPEQACDDAMSYYLFSAYNAWDMYNAIERALGLWENPDTRDQIMVNGMSGDYSWDVSADKYLHLYQSI